MALPPLTGDMYYFMCVAQETTWVAPPLVEELGAQFNEYMNAYGPGGYLRTEQVIADLLPSARATGASNYWPQKWNWTYYQKQGVGKITPAGNWSWSPSYTSPFTQYYLPPA